MLLNLLSFLILLIPSLLEGLGIVVDRRIFLLYFSTVSTLCYIYMSASSRPIKIPMLGGVLYILFLLFASVSTFLYSIDKQSSFELLLFYYSCFLFFILFYNYKEMGDKYVRHLPLMLGMSFTAYSFLIPFFRHNGSTQLLPIIEKQFVFASYLNHNHLGDYMGMVIFIFAYHFLQGRKWVLPFLLLSFVVMITSFSRSSYLAFLLTFTLIAISVRKKLSYALSFLFVVIFIAVVLISHLISFAQPPHSPFYRMQSYLMSTLHVAPRDVSTTREVFMTQSILSIKKEPLFGIGGGNFIIAAKRSVMNGSFSDSVHNVFLELMTEQGGIATTFFLLFILLIAIKVVRSPSLSGYLFLYLLLNFQTDYTYQMYSLFLFWIILMSVSYSEKKEFPISHIFYGCISIIPLLVFVFINTSALLVKMNNAEKAIDLYPYNKAAYISAIRKPSAQTPSLIVRANKIAPFDMGILIASAEYYSKLGNESKSLDYYLRIYQTNHLCPFYYINRIYFLKRKLYSQKEADTFLKGFALNYKNRFLSDSLKKEFMQFCTQVSTEKCRKVGLVGW